MEEGMVGFKISDGWNGSWDLGIMSVKIFGHLGMEEGMFGVKNSDSWGWRRG